MQGLHWFSQEPARKDSTTSVGIKAIKHHDVQITSQPSVLKSIVQQQDFGIQLFDGNAGRGHAIRIL